ncbi:MAG: methyl-accepting chemotaxis protein [Nitrospira sp.]|nr:methyl-accepting chemotaxis protein [Nitrospira sp.]
MANIIGRLTIRWKLALLTGPFVAGLLMVFTIMYGGIEEIKVNGPLYTELAIAKDLLADVLPPTDYLVESYLVTLEMLQPMEPAALTGFIARSKQLEDEYYQRHRYWLDALRDSPIKEQLTIASAKPAKLFFDMRNREFIPAVQAGNLAKAQAVLINGLKPLYLEHRRAIDEVIALSMPWQKGLEQHASDRMHELINQVIGTTALILLVSIAIGLAVARCITRPIGTLMSAFGDFAKGDLTGHIAITGTDELSRLALAFNQCTENFKTTLGKVAYVTDKVASASVELSATAEEISKGTDSLTSRASQTAAAVEEMNATVGQVAQNSSKASVLTQETVKTAKDGGAVVSDTISGMQQLSDAVTSSATIISDLGKSSNQIGEIVRVIEDIADQTNLLALNAAIEAARAGEQGRGFAVVADEVRKLAERTTKATKEIGDMIRQIQQDTRGAVESMQAGTVKVTSGVDLVNRTGEALARIVEMVSESADMIRQIAVASEEQSVATQQIANDVENVAKVTKESASGANESAKASHDLTQLATELQGIVGSFKL